VGEVQIQDKTTGLWLTPAQAKAPRGELRSIKTDK
jgi:hypothetical protein